MTDGPAQDKPKADTQQTIASDGALRAVGLSPLPRIDRYEVLAEIGRGGMGVVYRARQVDLDRVVALKVMVAGEHASEVALARFQREAHAAARLSHPNIVPVYDVGADGPRHWFTMRYVEGRSLSSLISAGDVSPRRAMELTRTLALALAYAHGQGVVHRDVKPGNILLDAAGEPHLADFGLAKEMEGAGVTLTGTAIGTPAYAPPEQVLGEAAAVGPQSDVYSLGATLYEMLTARPPFHGDGAFSIITKVISEEPVAPRVFNARIHPDIETICLKAMEKDRARRYGGAQELADDVGRFLEGEPIQARRLSWYGRVSRKVRRSPWTAAMAAALLVAIGVVAVLAVASSVNERREREQRERLVADYVRELARSGQAFVDASLACRRVADLRHSRTYAERLREPIARLKVLAPWLPEPWYHEGRMLRALGRDDEAERSQNLAVGLASGPSHDAVRCLALYERGVLRARRYLVDRGETLLRMASERFAEGTPFDPPTPLEAESSTPSLRVTRDGAVKDLEEADAYLRSDRPLAELDADDRRARVLVAQGLLAMLQWRDAERLLVEALGIDPSLQEALLALAGTAQGEGDHEDVARWLERATRADRGYIPYWTSLAASLRTAAAQLEATGGDGAVLRTRGIEAVEEALGIDPGNAALLRQRADLLMSQSDARQRRGQDPSDDLRAALAAAEKAVEADPARAESVCTLAQAHARLGDVLKGRGEDPRKEYELALAGYEQALAIEPDGVDALGDRSLVYQAIGEWKATRGGDPTQDYQKALDGFEAAQRLTPLATEPASNRGCVFQHLAQWKLSHGEDATAEMEAAIAEFDRALRINRRSSTAANNKGTANMILAKEAERRGKEVGELCRRAVEAYEIALSINPRNALVLMNVANVHLLQGEAKARRGKDASMEYRQAVEGYRRALEVNPALVGAANNLAIALRSLAEIEAAGGGEPEALYEEAVEAAERALRINPADLDASSSLGTAHQSRAAWRKEHGKDPTEDLDRSLAAYDQALRLNPRFADAASNKSIVLGLRGEWKAAHGGDPTPDYEEAIEALDLALSINPRFLEAMSNRANLWKLLGDAKAQKGRDPTREYAKAQAGFQQALEADPLSSQAAFNLGLMHWLAAERRGKRGDVPQDELSRAAEAFDKAIAITPGWATAHMQRGLVRKAQGDWKKRSGEDASEDYAAAMEAYDHAIALKSDLWQAHVNRAEILKTQGDLRGALAALERAHAIIGDGFPPLVKWIEETRAKLKEE